MLHSAGEHEGSAQSGRTLPPSSWAPFSYGMPLILLLLLPTHYFRSFPAAPSELSNLAACYDCRSNEGMCCAGQAVVVSLQPAGSGMLLSEVSSSADCVRFLVGQSVIEERAEHVGYERWFFR